MEQPKGATKVFCGGLSWQTDDSKLANYFSNFGNVLEAFVSVDKFTGGQGLSGTVWPCHDEACTQTVPLVYGLSRPR